MAFLFFGMLSGTNAQTTPIAIGQVVWVKGILKAVQPNASPRVLSRRSPIFEKDTLMTSDKSTGEIVFSDNSLLSLRENTTLQIAEYQYGAGNQPSKDTFTANIVKGGFRTITGAISKNHPEGYETKTPVATIGTLGTLYSVYINGGKLYAKVDRGGIILTNSKGRVVLQRCSQQQKDKKTPCVSNPYGYVSVDSAPVSITSEPTIFTSDPSVTEGSFGGGAGGGGGSGGGNVASFCIS
jgi:hypothetical protein